MIQVFDDVFCEEEKTNIENFFTSDNIPWYYYDHTGIVSEYDTVKDINTQDSAQFVHNFYNTRLNGVNSDSFYKIEPIIKKIQSRVDVSFELLRVKSNLMIRDSSYPLNFYNLPHQDSSRKNVKTFIYYINDSDGDTYFFNESPDQFYQNPILSIKHKQTPKKGNLLFFDSEILHASSPPKTAYQRLVINIVVNMLC